MATEFNGNEIKAMSIKYAERMYDASQKSVTGVDLNKEFLVLKLSKADIDYLTKPIGCTGLYCIFGLDGDAQSVIMVPHGSNAKALPLDTSGAIKGMNRWGQEPPKMKDIVFPNNPSNLEISVGVTDLLTGLGIL